MTFYKTPLFEEDLEDIGIKNEDYEKLKNELEVNPQKGNVIQGSGGCRKVRMGFGNKGKRSGARVIYIYIELNEIIYFIMAYSKNEKIDLSPKDKKAIKKYSEYLKQLL